MAGGAIDFGRKADLPPGLERLKARHELIPAHRKNAPAVVGARFDGEGWKVLLLAAGEDLALLDAGSARELARGLLTMADVIEGKRW